MVGKAPPPAEISNMKELFFQPGEVLQNRYRIDHLISSTGTSQVYKATDLRFLGKSWVLKVLKNIPSEQFKNLGKRWTSFNHPHLIKILDFFQEKENQILVMEYVNGQPLVELAGKTSTPFSEKQVLCWGLQCCDVIIYLQENLDDSFHFVCLSPKKILISAAGVVKLIPNPEFSWSTSTAVGIIGCSPPEIFEDPPLFNKTSDLYTLAAVLYRCLSGQDSQSVPFVFPQLRSLNAKISTSIDKALARAIQPDPGKRYPDLPAFRGELYKCFLELMKKQKTLPETRDRTLILWKLVMALSAFSSLSLMAWLLFYR